MRLSSILMTYMIVGAVMWGGGVIAYNDTGVATYLIDNPQTNQLNENVTEDIENSGGPIKQAANSIGGGGLLAVWNLLSALLGFFFWPITVLMALNAPPQATVLIGGSLSLGFLLGIIRIIATI